MVFYLFQLLLVVLEALLLSWLTTLGAHPSHIEVRENKLAEIHD